MACPLFSSSPPGSTECTCLPNHVNTSGVCTLTCTSPMVPDAAGRDCVPCAANKYYSDVDTCTSCPTYSVSPVGSSSFSACTCIPGTVMEV